MKKAIIVVIDSFGIGSLPDAKTYNDSGANTIKHICENTKVNWINLKKLGLGNASFLINEELKGCEKVDNPIASYGIMAEKSPGKDTTTGHWEMAGIILEKPFTVFPQTYPSFPKELINELCKRTKIKGILGNKAASGTKIIQELGAEHDKTGFPICYTSADSVFQIAANTAIIPLKKLYDICEVARELCDKYNIGRVIARPFIKEGNTYIRTKDRHDFSIALPEKSLLNHLQDKKINTVAVGKIGPIFNESGINQSYHDSGNEDCIRRMIELSKEINETPELIFVNLVDTDMIFGHRRDVLGYGKEVNNIDIAIGQIINNIKENDLLIIVGDHGCDPTFKGSDHTREYVPILWYEKGKTTNNLGIRNSFADMSQSICKYFNINSMKNGISFI
ncbi:MAG: phosphopentomutase [Pleomorphochaeta sp.]